MEVMGVPTKEIEMEFYNTVDPDQDKIYYRVQPVIIRNLQFPCLLSENDLEKLKANVNFETKSVDIQTKKGMLTFNLVGAPRRPTSVHLCSDVVIPPCNEVISMVTIKGGQEGD